MHRKSNDRNCHFSTHRIAAEDHLWIENSELADRPVNSPNSIDLARPPLEAEIESLAENDP
jgi:hypothetical protein